jgi:acetyltransferase-like isoleucine patch superfamily enzyme
VTHDVPEGALAYGVPARVRQKSEPGDKPEKK